MKRRSVQGKLLKSIAYRIVAFIISFGITYAATGSLKSAGIVAIAIEIAKFILYYVFETAWDSVAKYLFEDATFRWKCDECGEVNSPPKPPKAGADVECTSCNQTSIIAVKHETSD